MTKAKNIFGNISFQTFFTLSLSHFHTFPYLHTYIPQARACFPLDFIRRLDPGVRKWRLEPRTPALCLNWVKVLNYKCKYNDNDKTTDNDKYKDKDKDKDQ